MHRLLKGELNSVRKFKEKFSGEIRSLIRMLWEKYNIALAEEELAELLLSSCRSNDFGIIHRAGNKIFMDEQKVLEWVEKKLVPSTIILKLDDENVIRLLIFCIEITYQMFGGGTKATTSAKGFRERRRTFEAILVDQFVGKLGEIMAKKFLENNFPVKIELDWEISRQIEKHRNDIINAKKNISIKSSSTLVGVWAEADIGYDYGITVKCSVPQPTILQFFIEVCGFSRLIDFAEGRIPSADKLFRDYIGEMKKRIKGYHCGKIQTDLKGFICGYFNTADYSPVKKGISLEYLGTVREERFLVPLSALKWTLEQWREFLQDVKLL